MSYYKRAFVESWMLSYEVVFQNCTALLNWFFLHSTSRVVVALCGGNIDTTALGRVIDRGLAADGRLIRFVVTVSDRPGGIAELTKLLADMGVR